MGGFLARLRQAAPTEAWDTLPAGAEERLELFARACPLYARLIEHEPALALMLESAETREQRVGLPTLLDAIRRHQEVHGPLERTAPGYPGFLRRFRRRMTMRIAYRDVAGFAPEETIVEELTRLAELMIGECTLIALTRATERWGEPWDEARDRAATFCVLGLGKLGGRELNFSSDVDLIYLYDGDGHTRRDSRSTTTTNAEYFQRVAEEMTRLLNERDADGFLYRADLRLRPGGAAAALAPSVAAVENYYAATGQTWERLALLKARVIAGDPVTGGELLESLHSFRYPRHPPASLLTDVAAMKQRTETEVVGSDALERNIKSGFGGIREIEFFTQALQLVHAARFPFLQTHSTVEALRQLARYEVVPAGDAQFLIEAYWLLRRVEHRLQMAEEQQTHDLPVDPDERAALARSLGFADATAFERRLTETRQRVRRHYAELFATGQPAAADAADPWWPFFADGRLSPAVVDRLESWFDDSTPAEAARALRLFVRGEESLPLVREQVQRFTSLIPALDRVLPRLARPRTTLGRISTFAERYATRNQFLAACTMNREFFEVLALLFDRSRFIAELLTQHPEIFDEVLRPEILHKRKDVAARRRELAAHGTTREEDHQAWLRLYVRAEQVRAAIGHLLGFLEDDEIGAELSGLAEATLQHVVARTPGAGHLAVIALGKFGGNELSYGSDLDVVILGREGGQADERLVRTLQRQLGSGGAGDPTFALDLRLRPHGDVGPLVPTLGSYRAYFEQSAQLWERQVLTRARVVAGDPDLAQAWETWRSATVFGRPLAEAEAANLWRMRLRIQRERDVVRPPERAFKTGAGGMVDIEFALQILQLHHGGRHPAIRSPNTREGWRQLSAAGLVPKADVAQLLDNHRHLQRLEWCLRRDQNRGASVIPDGEDDQRAVARWLGARDWAEFWDAHRERLQQTRDVVIRSLTGVVPSTALETDR